MDIDFIFLKTLLFFQYKSLPILVNIVFLSFWLPLLFKFFYRKEKIFIFFALALLFLFVKELMLFLTTKEMFFNFNYSNVFNFKLNWIILESLFFYIFFMLLYDSYQLIAIDKKYHYPPIKILFKKNDLFFNWLGIILFIFFLFVSLVYLSEVIFFNVLIIVFYIIFFQKTLKSVKKNYRFFNIPSLKTETLFYFFFFCIISLAIFVVFGIYTVLSFFEANNQEIVENYMEKFIHPLKSVSYFFLLFMVNAILKDKYKSEERKTKINKTSEIILTRFFTQLNQQKMLLVPPIRLLTECVDWLRKKLEVDYVAINLPMVLLNKINAKNLEKESQLNILEEIYLEKENFFWENRGKVFFYNNLQNLDFEIKKFLHENWANQTLVSPDQKNNQEVTNKINFSQINSFFSFPLFSPSNILLGNMMIINVSEKNLYENQQGEFLQKFLLFLTEFLEYFERYEESYKKRKMFFKRKIEQEYIHEIKTFERKIEKKKIIHETKVEIRKNTVFENNYPNNFFLIKENKDEIFVFANYFLGNVKRNLTIINNLALLNGLSDEFISNVNSQKTVSVFLKKINNFFSFLKNDENFIASFVLSYKINSKELFFSNASHFPVFIYNSKKNEFWSYDINEGIPLGLKKGEDFDSGKTVLNKNDILFFLPQLDFNVRNEKYNFDNLYRLIRKKLENPLEVINQVMQDDLENFYSRKHENRINFLTMKILD